MSGIAKLASVTLQPPLFPIDQPVMPEERQIGRASPIQGLERRLLAVSHQWLIGERRTGKTSVAKAVFARLRRRGSVALEADLTRPALSTPKGLAGEIARQARAAHAGLAADARRIVGFARRRRSQAKGLGRALGELGFEDAGEALAAVAALLAGADGGEPGLNKVLGAIALHARATEQRAFLLLDEVHLLADLPDSEATIARWCREEDSPIVLVFAGSEEAAVRELRERGRPLAAVGSEFRLPPIRPEDWRPALRERFEEGGVTIGDPELDAIVAASDGHPRRTMLVASNVHATAMQVGRIATETLVELAIRDAERDRSWA